jgi:hypothetical protein
LARLEYLHYDFGKSNTFSSTTSVDFQTSGRLTADIVRAGPSYQLGQDPGAASYASAANMTMPVKAPQAAPWTWSGFRVAHPARPAIRRIARRDRADEIFFGLDSDDFWRDDRLSRRRRGSTIGNLRDLDDHSPRKGAAEAAVISICRQSPTNRFVGVLCFPSETATGQECQSGFCLWLM